MRDYLNTLLAMHSYCRPHGTETETAFCTRFIEPLGAERDLFGNWHYQIGESPIIWSCHTDTVHRKPGRQTVHYNNKSGMLKLSKRSRRTSSCLGADDTAGVFLCCEMIKRKVPGHYIFHYGEESGGLGSSDLALEWPELLNGATFAIALDRAGNSNVITHQAGGRTASDAFAHSLAAQLNTDGLKYAPCDAGIYTDTAEYAPIVAECSNLSVGYYAAHTEYEQLDTWHLLRLLERLCALDQSALVAERVPAAIDRGWGRSTLILDWPIEETCPDCDEELVYSAYCFKCGWDEKRPRVPITDVIDDEHLADWQTRDDSADVYLQSDYAAVQAALRRYRN
jgi:hypothetical protein